MLKKNTLKKSNKYLKLSNLIIVDYKKKSTVIFIIIILVSLIYNYLSTKKNIDSTKTYSKTIIEKSTPNIDDTYIRPKNKIDFSSIYSIIISYKTQKNSTPYNLLSIINEKQAILIRNFIDIDLYNFLIGENPKPELDYSNLIQSNNLNPQNIQSMTNKTNVNYIINTNIIKENCNNEYCVLDTIGNNFYDFRLLIDNKSSIDNYNEYKEYSQIFLCQNLNIDDKNPKQINFSSCLYQKNFINQYANNLSLLLENYPDYLTEKAKHLVYSALISYFYINLDSVCYENNIELLNDKNICLNELNNMKTSRNLKTNFSNFTYNSKKYQEILKISLKNNNQYIDYNLETAILNNIQKQLPKPLTSSQRFELTIQLNNLYKPGDNFNDSKANNLNNYNIDKIYEK